MESAHFNVIIQYCVCQPLPKPTLKCHALFMPHTNTHLKWNATMYSQQPVESKIPAFSITANSTCWLPVPAARIVHEHKTKPKSQWISLISVPALPNEKMASPILWKLEVCHFCYGVQGFCWSGSCLYVDSEASVMARPLTTWFVKRQRAQELYFHNQCQHFILERPWWTDNDSLTNGKQNLVSLDSRSDQCSSYNVCSENQTNTSPVNLDAS